MVERNLADAVAATLSETNPPAVVVSVLRGLDCVEMTSGSPVVVIELKIVVEGAVLSPDLCGDLDLKAAVASFPSVPLGRDYQALDVRLEDLFDLSKCFNFYLEESVEDSDRAALTAAATLALRETNPGKRMSCF